MMITASVLSASKNQSVESTGVVRYSMPETSKQKTCVCAAKRTNQSAAYIYTES